MSSGSHSHTAQDSCAHWPSSGQNAQSLHKSALKKRKYGLHLREVKTRGGFAHVSPMELRAHSVVKFCKMGKTWLSFALFTVLASQQQSLMLPLNSVDCKTAWCLRIRGKTNPPQLTSQTAHLTASYTLEYPSPRTRPKNSARVRKRLPLAMYMLRVKIRDGTKSLDWM